MAEQKTRHIQNHFNASKIIQNKNVSGSLQTIPK